MPWQSNSSSPTVLCCCATLFFSRRECEKDSQHRCQNHPVGTCVVDLLDGATREGAGQPMSRGSGLKPCNARQNAPQANAATCVFSFERGEGRRAGYAQSMYQM